jgi:prevent-host-death family protein
MMIISSVSIDMVIMFSIAGTRKMQKTISAIKARQNLGQIMNEVSLKGDEFVIERAGKPIAVLVSMDKYKILQKYIEEAKTAVHRIREKMKDEPAETIESLIDEAITAVRKK